MRSFALAAGIAIFAFAAPSSAQTPPSPQAAAAAETLFSEARALLASGDREGACRKFDESYRIDTTAMGTLFNLALCNERAERYATAWVQFREVAAESRTKRPDRAALAEERARAIEPKLSKLRIVVPASLRGAPGLEVTVDGVVIPAASYDALPIDGGSHKIGAKARRRAPVELTATAPVERGVTEVVIPELAEVAETDPVPSAPRRPEGGVSQSTLGWVAGAAGVGALAVGTGFGLSALLQADDVQNTAIPRSERESKYRELDAHAYVADVGLAVGAILIVTSAVLLLTDKREPAARVSGRFRAPRAGTAISF